MNDYDQNYAFCSHGSDDLLKLDLTPFNVKFVGVDAADFNEIIAALYGFTSPASDPSHFYENTPLWKELDEHSPLFGYVLVPIDRNVKVRALTLYRIIDCLNILFPSEFRMHWYASLRWHNERLHDTFKVGRHKHTPYFSHLLEGGSFDMFELPKMDLEVLNTAVQKRCKLKIDTFPFDLLVHSYNECGILPSVVMSYVALCIGLESLVVSQTEISHIIARTCAVLNADTREEGRIIYKKTKKAYDIRSKIVHGSTKIGDLRDEFRYLIALVSTTFNAIVELGIKDVESLNEFVTESGFGDRLALNDKILNINPELRAILVAPPPLKPNASTKKTAMVKKQNPSKSD